MQLKNQTVTSHESVKSHREAQIVTSHRRCERRLRLKGVPSKNSDFTPSGVNVAHASRDFAAKLRNERISDSCKSPRRKGISPLLAGMLFTAIIITTTSLMMAGIIPSLRDIQDTIVIDSMQESLNYLNQYIGLVAQEGERSQRLLPLSFKRGTFTIDSANTSKNNYGKLFFELETNSQAVSPRTSRKIGDVTFSSNANVSVYNNVTEFIMDNEHLRVSINKSGSSSNHVTIDTSKLLKNIYFKDDSKTMFSGSDRLLLKITGLPPTVTGYVDVEQYGTDLPKCVVIAYLNYSSVEYEIHFILESGTDYLKLRVVSPDFFDWVEANITSTNFVTGTSDIKISKKHVESSTSGTTIGLISDNDASTGYSIASHMLHLNQPFKINKLYIAFTRGEPGTINDRLHYINDKTFEKLYSPSFGFKVEKQNKIRLTLDYDDINLYFDDSKDEIVQKLQAGNYNLLIKNLGTTDDRTDILVKLV